MEATLHQVTLAPTPLRPHPHPHPYALTRTPTPSPTPLRPTPQTKNPNALPLLPYLHRTPPPPTSCLLAWPAPDPDSGPCPAPAPASAPAPGPGSCPRLLAWPRCPSRPRPVRLGSGPRTQRALRPACTAAFLPTRPTPVHVYAIMRAWYRRTWRGHGTAGHGEGVREQRRGMT